MKIISLKNKFVDTLTKCKYKVFKKVVEAILNEKASDAFNFSIDLLRLIRNEQDRINNIKFKCL